MVVCLFTCIFLKIIDLQTVYHEHSCVNKNLSVFGSMFSNVLWSWLKCAKAPANPFSVNFLREVLFFFPCSFLFFFPAPSSALHSYSSSNNFSLINSSGTTSKSTSMSSSSTLRLKLLAISNTVLIFATPSSLENSCSYEQWCH